MPNHPTPLGKRERQGAPSHCPPDSVPLAPRQGRSPVTCPPDRVPPFPLISGVFALATTNALNCFVAISTKVPKEASMQVMEKNLASGSTDQTERRWSYTSGTSDTSLLGLTIGDLFDQTVEKYPDHPALISRQQNIRLTYRDLQYQVNRCAKGLMHLGC